MGHQVAKAHLVGIEGHAAQNFPRSAPEANVPDVEYWERRRHEVDAFQRRSSREATAASGSDIAR